MAQRTAFQSRVSFEDATQQAQSQGFTVTGRIQNKSGYFVVFATRQPQVQRNPLDGSWLRGKI